MARRRFRYPVAVATAAEVPKDKPASTPGEHRTCFFCGFAFEDCDLPRVVESCYGNWIKYKGRKVTGSGGGYYGRCYGSTTTTNNDHDRLAVPFLPGIFVCRDCLAKARATANKIGSGLYVHPSIRALDAARERRLKQLDEAVPKPYNPFTWNHPSLRKWDAAVRAGKIDLGIRAAYRILPGVAKIGKGLKGVAVTYETMDEDEATAFRAETERRKAAERALRAAEMEAAKAELAARQEATETAPAMAAA